MPHPARYGGSTPIPAAPRSQLARALSAITELHQPRGGAFDWRMCSCCLDEYGDRIPWPCPTITVIQQQGIIADVETGH